MVTITHLSDQIIKILIKSQVNRLEVLTDQNLVEMIMLTQNLLQISGHNFVGTHV